MVLTNTDKDSWTNTLAHDNTFCYENLSLHDCNSGYNNFYTNIFNLRSFSHITYFLTLGLNDLPLLPVIFYKQIWHIFKISSVC